MFCDSAYIMYRSSAQHIFHLTKLLAAGKLKVIECFSVSNNCGIGRNGTGVVTDGSLPHFEPLVF
jgi:hypothetical protein